MSLHTWRRQSPCKPSSCTTFTLKSHWAELPQAKKKSVSSCTGLLRTCPTLCDPVDCGLPGFSVRGLLQARILERIGQYWLPYPSVQCLVSCVRLFANPQTAALQPPLSMGFSRQEYWSGLEHYISCCPSCQLP